MPLSSEHADMALQMFQKSVGSDSDRTLERLKVKCSKVYS